MGSLSAALLARIEAWGLDGEPEAAAALDLAERLEVEGLRPAAAAMLHGQLRAVLKDLREMAPEADSADDIDALKAKLKLLPGAASA